MFRSVALSPDRRTDPMPRNIDRAPERPTEPAPTPIPDSERRRRVDRFILPVPMNTFDTWQVRSHARQIQEYLPRGKGQILVDDLMLTTCVHRPRPTARVIPSKREDNSGAPIRSKKYARVGLDSPPPTTCRHVSHGAAKTPPPAMSKPGQVVVEPRERDAGAPRREDGSTVLRRPSPSHAPTTGRSSGSPCSSR